MLASGRNSEEQEARAAADFERPFRMKRKNPVHGVANPLAQVRFRNQLACETAVDAGCIECRIGGLTSAVRRVPDFLPQGVDLSILVVRGFMAGFRRHVTDQRRLTRGIFPHHNHALTHSRKRQHRGFDFAQFDPMTPYLHLMIHAAQALNTAVRPVTSQIPGSVEAGSRLRVERMRDEFFGGQLGTVQIAARHAVASDEKLAGNAGRNRLKPGVDNVNLGIGDRPANGDAIFAGLNSFNRRPAGGFRRAVHIP